MDAVPKLLLAQVPAHKTFKQTTRHKDECTHYIKMDAVLPQLSEWYSLWQLWRKLPEDFVMSCSFFS